MSWAEIPSMKTSIQRLCSCKKTQLKFVLPQQPKSTCMFAIIYLHTIQTVDAAAS